MGMLTVPPATGLPSRVMGRSLNLWLIFSAAAPKPASAGVSEVMRHPAKVPASFTRQAMMARPSLVLHRLTMYLPSRDQNARAPEGLTVRWREIGGQDARYGGAEICAHQSLRAIMDVKTGIESGGGEGQGHSSPLLLRTPAGEEEHGLERRRDAHLPAGLDVSGLPQGQRRSLAYPRSAVPGLTDDLDVCP